MDIRNAKRARATLSLFVGLSLMATPMVAMAENAQKTDEPTGQAQASEVKTEEGATTGKTGGDAQTDAADKQEKEFASPMTVEEVGSFLGSQEGALTEGQLCKALGTSCAAGDENKQVSVADTIDALMDYADLTENLPGYRVEDNRGLAINMGLIDYTTKMDGTVEAKDFPAMYKDVTTFKEAVAAPVKKQLFMNGMAQPIFPYSSGEDFDYSNAKSYVIRYSVWVPTNYDTDGDGKNDMVKAVVQVPLAAAKGDYKAPAIFEARPYVSGCTPFGIGYNGGTNGLNGVTGDTALGTGTNFNMADLKKAGSVRKSAKKVTTMQAAADAKSNQWYYVSPYESTWKGDDMTWKFMDYETLDWYDYYLTRGFGVVESAGLGTRRSEGYETCGADVEIDAFKCIVEWLHGDRKGFTSRDGDTEVDADWANGHVAMTGRSYGGTTTFGVAQTGVDGLDAIVPVSGIASWYDYYNCQGTRTSDFPGDQLSSLASYCAGRYIDNNDKGLWGAIDNDWGTIRERYGDYLNTLLKDQVSHGSDYSDTWADRDYTLNPEKKSIKAHPLIVHGLNDQNVTTKHYQLMYDTFKAEGVQPKLLFHQGGHLTPNSDNNWTLMIGKNQSYDDILNRWFSHWLCGVDNNAENMPTVTAQSNVDADVWNTYDSYDTVDDASHKIDVKVGSPDKVKTISSDYAANDMTFKSWVPSEWIPFHEKIAKDNTAVNVTFRGDKLEKDTTIKGVVRVDFKAAWAGDIANKEANPSDAPKGMTKLQKDTGVTGPESDNMPVTAMLMDVADEPFAAYESKGGRWASVATQGVEGQNSQYFLGCGLVRRNVNTTGDQWYKSDIIPVKNFATTQTSAKVIERGWVDLANPESGFKSDTAEKSIKLVKDEFNNYTLYLQPNVYTVKAGHHLALVLLPYDQEYVGHDGNYKVSFDLGSIKATIPTNGTDGSETTRLAHANPDDTASDLQKEIDALNKKQDELEKEIGDLKQADKEQKATIADLQAKLSDNEDKIADLQKKLDAAKEDNKAELDQMKKELQEKKDLLDKLQKEIDALKGKADGNDQEQGEEDDGTSHNHNPKVNKGDGQQGSGKSDPSSTGSSVGGKTAAKSGRSGLASTGDPASIAAAMSAAVAGAVALYSGWHFSSKKQD